MIMGEGGLSEAERKKKNKDEEDAVPGNTCPPGNYVYYAYHVYDSHTYSYFSSYINFIYGIMILLLNFEIIVILI